MDIRIGVIDTPKELTVEMPDDADPAQLQQLVQQAVAGAEPMLWITDRRGRQIGIPCGKLAYIEIGSDDDTRRIGFGG